MDFLHFISNGKIYYSKSITLGKVGWVEQDVNGLNLATTTLFISWLGSLLE